MPRRTDIKSILIIGAGPIIIGQACEFDYSGVQACKALKEEGYRVILVNSNPATIMTDPEMADVTYIEPITWQMVARIIEKERPDALLPTMGGQTALNCALDLAREGVLNKHDVELIGASKKAIDKAEDREKFKAAMTRIGLGSARSGTAHNLEQALEVQATIGFPAVIRPSFTLGGTGGGIAYNKDEFVEMCKHGLDMSPTRELLIEESLLGWKEFEMEVVRDRKDNCIIVCSIENLDPMGVHTGDSITVAPAQTLTDKEYQIMRDASIAVLREIGVDTGGSNVQFAINPKDGRMIVIEMNPRVSRSSALASKATGFPIAKVAAKLAVGYTLDELRNDITGGATPASFEPTIDYVVTKVPRFAFEKFKQADDRLTTQMKSVGEVMAIGRTFQESLQKALRGLEVGVDGFNLKTVDMDKIGDELAYPAGRAPVVRGGCVRRRHEPRVRAPLHEDRSLVPRADQGDRRRRARARDPHAGESRARGASAPEAHGLLGPATRVSAQGHRERDPGPAPCAGPASGVQARRHLCRGIRDAHRVHVLDVRGGVRGRADGSQEGDRAGRRTESHRAGHRVRLLLRARRDGAARGRVRDHHGQLQPGDGVDRLRHVGSPVLRAAHARGRARDRARGEAVRRDRAVRRADAAQARARPREERRADHRHLAGHDRHGGGPRALPADAAPSRSQAAAQPHGAHRGRGDHGSRGDRVSARRAPVVRAWRSRDGDRARAARPRALHARGGQGQQRLAGAARSLPERRDRGRRRRAVRRQGRRDRRDHGAHRAGRRAFRRLRVLAAAVFALRRRSRTSCGGRRSRWRMGSTCAAS